MNPSALQDSPEGVVLTVHVQPGAKRTEVAGLHGDAVKVRIAAPPVEGAANEALCAYLARLFDLPNAHVTVLTGQTARRKRVRLKTLTRARAESLLASLLPRAQG